MFMSPQNVHFSVFPAKASSPVPGSAVINKTHINQKRRRGISEPADSVKAAAKRLRNHPTVIEYPYAPTAPGARSHLSVSTNAPHTTLDTSNDRLAPSGSLEYDLTIRTNNRVAWVKWANDLHKEIGSLRHVQDLGDYTMGVIAMMKEDGVWPTGNLVDVIKEDGMKEEKEIKLKKSMKVEKDIKVKKGKNVEKDIEVKKGVKVEK